jgi:hypothetical protein
MGSRILSVAAALLLASTPTFVVDAAPSDSDLEKGVRQAQEGEFEQAIATLRAALPQLEEGPPADLIRAHVYLGVAHLGLGDTASAKASFLDALRVDRTLRLSAEDYPPRVTQAFEEARSALPPEPPPAAAASAAAPAAPPAATPAGSEASPASVAPVKEPARKKKSSSRPLVLVGLGLAAGGGVALAAGGGGGSSTPASSSPPTTLPPTPTGEVRLVTASPPVGGTVVLPPDPRAGMTVPEVIFEVVYGTDVANASFEINLWRGQDLCHSTQVAYAERLDGPGPQYRAGSTARYRVGWWTARQPGCGDAYVTDRFEFAWGSLASPLFIQNLAVGWSFSR